MGEDSGCRGLGRQEHSRPPPRCLVRTLLILKAGAVLPVDNGPAGSPGPSCQTCWGWNSGFLQFGVR